MIRLKDKYFQDLISEDELNYIVDGLIREVKSSIKDTSDLVVVGILNGAIPLFNRIIFSFKESIITDLMKVSSYGNKTVSSGKAEILLDIQVDVTDKDILVVDDIYDTGLTMDIIQDHLLSKGARTVKTCCLFNKENDIGTRPDFIGMTIDEDFIVGFGLDYAHTGRNLKKIVTLKK